MSERQYVVLGEIGCDQPEVFGPFQTFETARDFASRIRTDERIEDAEVVGIIHTADVDSGAYWRELDEAFE